MGTTGERVIRIIGFGIGLAVIAAALSWWVVSEIYEPQGGWFAYQPGTGAFVPERSADRSWAALWAGLIWVCATAVWAIISLRIWRGPRSGA